MDVPKEEYDMLDLFCGKQAVSKIWFWPQPNWHPHQCNYLSNIDGSKRAECSYIDIMAVNLQDVLSMHLRTENGYKCASFDRDLNPRTMDFLGAPGFVLLSYLRFHVKHISAMDRTRSNAQADLDDCCNYARELHCLHGAWLQLMGFAGQRHFFEESD